MVTGMEFKKLFACPDAAPPSNAVRDNTLTNRQYWPGAWPSRKNLNTSYFFHFCTGTRSWENNNSLCGNILYAAGTSNCPRLNFLGSASPIKKYYAITFLSPAQQPAVQDAYNIETKKWTGADNGYAAPNNHLNMNAHNVAYCDGHVAWLKDSEASRQHRDYYNRFFF